MQITNDRRSTPRVPARGEAFINIAAQRIRCSCVDLSETGVGVVGPFSARAGTVVDLELSVDGRSMTVPARVARARRRRDGFLWGLSFDPMRSPELSAVVRAQAQRLTWMRQAKPYLDRLRGVGRGGERGSAQFAPGALSVEVAIPPARAAAPPPVAAAPDVPPAYVVPVADEMLEDAPTTVYDAMTLRDHVAVPPLLQPPRPATLPAASNTQPISIEDIEDIEDWSDLLTAAESRPIQLFPRIGRLDHGVEAQVLAELDAAAAAVPPTFNTPPVPPVRRPVPTLAAPAVAQANLLQRPILRPRRSPNGRPPGRSSRLGDNDELDRLFSDVLTEARRKMR